MQSSVVGEDQQPQSLATRLDACRVASENAAESQCTQVLTEVARALEASDAKVAAESACSAVSRVLAVASFAPSDQAAVQFSAHVLEARAAVEVSSDLEPPAPRTVEPLFSPPPTWPERGALASLCALVEPARHRAREQLAAKASKWLQLAVSPPCGQQPALWGLFLSESRPGWHWLNEPDRALCSKVLADVQLVAKLQQGDKGFQAVVALLNKSGPVGADSHAAAQLKTELSPVASSLASTAFPQRRLTWTWWRQS